MEPYIPDILPLKSIDWESHVSLIGQANAALARYDGILLGMVNPQVLLSPLTTREAVLSSRIEGTQASLEEVLQYEADFGDAGPDKDIAYSSQIQDIHEIINTARQWARQLERWPAGPWAQTQLESCIAYCYLVFAAGTRTPVKSAASRTTLHPQERP